MSVRTMESAPGVGSAFTRLRSRDVPHWTFAEVPFREMPASLSRSRPSPARESYCIRTA
jgi:hypothetical protein